MDEVVEAWVVEARWATKKPTVTAGSPRRPAKRGAIR
jgi:hypothetical protein